MVYNLLQVFSDAWGDMIVEQGEEIRGCAFRQTAYREEMMTARIAQLAKEGVFVHRTGRSTFLSLSLGHRMPLG